MALRAGRRAPPCHDASPLPLASSPSLPQGRAGRDGQPSRSLVYYSVQDRQRLEYVLSKGEEEQAERRAQRRGGQQQPGSGGGGERPRQVVQFGQVRRQRAPAESAGVEWLACEERALLRAGSSPHQPPLT